MLNRLISILVAVVMLSGCKGSLLDPLPASLDITATNAPTLQVSSIGIIPTLVMPTTSFFSTAAGSLAQVTAGGTVLVNSTATSLVGPTVQLSLGTISSLGLSMVNNSLGSAAGLAFTDFGSWVVTNTITGQPAGSVKTYITYAGGTTLTATRPTTGQATYANGGMTGVLVYPPAGGVKALLSSNIVNLVADFAANTFSGTLTATGSNNIGYTFTLSGLIGSGNSFAGTVGVQTNNIGDAVTGTTMTMAGNFYGPLANEVAGTFTITTTADLSKQSLIGSFAAKQ